MIFYKDFNFDLLSKEMTKTVKKRERGGIIFYLNYPVSFDIETTSFYDNNGNKRATMYIFMFSINGHIIYGRTWSDFNTIVEKLKSVLKLHETRKIIVYVHNLAYEFQFLYSICDVTNVFARSPHKVIKCDINECFEFRCSYFLSGSSLENLAKDLTSVEIEKQIGTLDYSLKRHSKSYLSIQELKYCEYDVKILHYFIMEEMKKNGNNISKIPLTKTGYVRRYCLNYIQKHTNYIAYREKIKSIAPTGEKLFILMHKAFAGGYTHANCLHIFDKIENVSSVDFTSSYPAQMVMHKYPMSKFLQCKIDTRSELEKMVKNYACLMEIEFKNLQAKTSTHILSRSKCSYLQNEIIDNGRVVNADFVQTFLTDIDYKLIQMYYDFDGVRINQFYYSQYKYLPKELVECALEFYGDKTTLKGVEAQEENYLIKKGMLNGIYGMCVTNPVNDEIVFNDGEWREMRGDISELLDEQYNKNIKQFLVYQWGVWVTAWARYELLTAVYKIGDDVIYCDTDSIKFVTSQNHKKIIDEQNKRIISDLEKALKFHGIPKEKIYPRDKFGVVHPLGIFEYEKSYKYFKTLGAKRYCFSYGDNDFNITVAGLGKIKSADYIKSKGGFDFFDDGMYIPPDYTGKLTHTYIDEEYNLTMIDYSNIPCKIHEKSYIHLEKQDYNLSLANDFINYLNGLNDNLIENSKPWAVREELAVNEMECE